MEQIRYQTLRDQGYEGFLLPEAPERVLQFGEGNFLRAFADYFIDIANEKVGFDAKVVVVQPIQAGLAHMLNAQEGLYTLYLRGLCDGKKIEERRIVSCISRAVDPYEDYDAFIACAGIPTLRYIISNTTEAGIVFDEDSNFDQKPPVSFPAKLTRLLYERYRIFGQDGGKGFIILPCELIDHNGEELKHCVMQYIGLWQLEDAFARWVEQENYFCSTLVDRIVTGFPKNEAQDLHQQNGYEDQLLNTAEVFGLWVIEGPECIAHELPFAKAGLPVKVVRDHTPYKQRKVRILNGAHTSMVPAAYLAGRNIVRECMEDSVIRGFMQKTIQQEIIPTLTLPREELEAFAHAVTERFQNPFIDHSLLSITLNCTAKWRARVLPSLKGYWEKFGRLPACIVFSFAAYLQFYRGNRLEQQGLIGCRGNEEYVISDDRPILELFLAHRDADNQNLVNIIGANRQLWGEDLTLIPGFVEQAAACLDAIDRKGMYGAMEQILQQD